METRLLVPRDAIASFLQRRPAASMDGAIKTAEQLVSAAIGGSIYERAFAYKRTLLYALTQYDVFMLDDGPIASIESLTLDNAAVAALDFVISSRWGIRFLNGADASALLAISGKNGFTAANLPRQLREAIIVTAATLFKNPDQAIIAERLGDYSKSISSFTASAEAAPIVAPVKLLVSGFARPTT